MPDTFFWKDEWFSVVECQECGLAFVNPRPNYAEMGRYYPPDYYEDFEQNRDYHLRRYAIEANFVEKVVPTGERRLLDVGCANGGFPRFMRGRGWQVEGVEVSSSSKGITDFRVYKDEFPRISFSKASYDAVTAWAVLEHVHDPAEYFRAAWEVLRPGGAFVFLVTNFASISSSRLFREDVPRHLYFFTEETIRKYLQKYGFRLVASDFSDRIFAMLPVNWLHYYLKFRWRNRPFRFEDAQLSRQQYLADRGLHPGLHSTVRFFFANPHLLPDRLFRKAFERYQMMTRTYGIATYVAVKSP